MGGNQEPQRTALVLSAAGMFGAYQAGVWQALEKVFRPDLVAGTSAGALNGWIIASLAPAERLVSYWLDPETAGLARYRRPIRPWRGVFDSQPLHDRIQRLWAAHRPQIPIGITAVELPRLQTRLFLNEEIGWEHIAASCAVLFGYEQVRIGDKYYTDGGLLEVLPLSAAVAMGATRIVAINALPFMPSRTVRLFVRVVRSLARTAGPAAEIPDVHVISPAGPLGKVRHALFWTRDTAERLIAMGAEDGARFAASAEWLRATGGGLAPSPLPGRDAPF